jgi:hypothetical protein
MSGLRRRLFGVADRAAGRRVALGFEAAGSSGTPGRIANLDVRARLGGQLASIGRASPGRLAAMGNHAPGEVGVTFARLGGAGAG